MTVLAFAPALLLMTSGAAQPVVWVTHATAKIRPSDAPGTGSSADIKAARNEFEAFQVALHGGASGLTGVRAAAPTLAGPAGHAIPAANVRLYREALLNTPYASTMESSAGEWPDPLVPDIDETANEQRNAFPFDVPPERNRALWIEVLVPVDAMAGEYTGVLALTADGGWSATVSVSLTVWPFTLPSTASLASTFKQDWDALCQAYYGGYGAPECGEAGIVRTHQQLAAFMLDHRLTVDIGYAGPAKSGASYDWASWDAQYGPYFDGTAPTRLAGAKQTLIRYVWNSSQASYAAWAQHFRQKGWFDRTFDYTCDEPPATCAWRDINSRAATIHGADPEFRTLVTTTVGEADSNGVLGSIDILVPVINAMHDKGGSSQRSRYDAFLGDSSHRLLWYQSCMSQGCGGDGAKSYDPYFNGWATVMIDAPAVRNRAMEWLSFTYDISGELYWDTTYAFNFGNDPWTNQWFFAGNGDGTLLYPGTPRKIGGSTPVPVASIRLKMIREGMEDYEYLKLVSDLGDPAFAKEQAALVAANPFTITANPSALYAVREALAARILALSGPAPCSDGTVEGQCSASQPLRCTAGTLVPSCESCGCPAGLTCGAPGECIAAPGGTDGGDSLPGSDGSQTGRDSSSVPGPDGSSPTSGHDTGTASDETRQEPPSASCQTVAGAPWSAALALVLGLAFRRRRAE
ncbi:MAG: DUF4091 domain-containing protein [Deltaproteobacteria bacterium]|nr:DUF4091 domain-containing protein [Deltaproteobacteria bacterium]